jgi:hypothetical protein
VPEVAERAAHSVGVWQRRPAGGGRGAARLILSYLVAHFLLFENQIISNSTYTLPSLSTKQCSSLPLSKSSTYISNALSITVHSIFFHNFSISDSF